MKGQIQTALKTEVWRRDKRLRHLADALSMSRGRLYRILNGYDNEPKGFARKVKAILVSWDNIK
ncbi:MAG: hypothetical protein HQK83_04675 [Fibrobacteria bacterium]|nr:hypothetical protein [Fibrobacteria bacterium]